MADRQSRYPVEFGYMNRIVQLPPATDDQIAVVEARFGELPADYKRFLKTVNGGRPSRPFMDVSGWSFDIECFNGLGGDPTGSYAVERRSAWASEILERQVVAIAGNGAGDQLIFLSAGDPAVYQPPANPGTRLSPPAASNTSRLCLSPPELSRRPVKLGRGEPHAALRNPGYLDAHHGQPRPSSHQPDYTLLGPTPLRLCKDRRRARHPTNA
jgi:hypothetical protein